MSKKKSIAELGNNINVALGTLGEITIPDIAAVPNQLEVIYFKINKIEKQLVDLKTKTESHGNDAEVNNFEKVNELITLSKDASKLCAYMVSKMNTLVDAANRVKEVISPSEETSKTTEKLAFLTDEAGTELQTLKDNVRKNITELLTKADEINATVDEGRKHLTEATEEYSDLSEIAKELLQQMQQQKETEKETQLEQIVNTVNEKEDKHQHEITVGRSESSCVVVIHFAVFLFFLFYVCVFVS